MTDAAVESSMTAIPSRVLTELLAEHDALRELIERCEQLADELEAGRTDSATLSLEVSRLRAAFDVHNRYEEQFLRPVLRGGARFGEHVAEHQSVRASLENEVTGELRRALDHLRRHLDDEDLYFKWTKQRDQVTDEHR